MTELISLGQHDAEPLKIGMLLYPGLTLLDLVGPQAALGMHGRTFLLWKDLEPVRADTGISVNPTTTLADCPRDLDVLFVPGGFGTNQAMQDRAVIDFLAEVGPTARYVTSVCTGALLLGMAGLLDGYRANTHWAFRDALEATGAVVTDGRVVVDRNRVTGGGGTAGIDFGLTLLAALRGEQVAQVTQLALEYNPEPPFQAGTPEKAGAAVTGIALAMIGAMKPEAVAVARGRRLGPAAAQEGVRA